MSEEKINKCPIPGCGKEISFWRECDEGKWYARCEHCFYRLGGFYDTKEEAIIAAHNSIVRVDDLDKALGYLFAAYHALPNHGCIKSDMLAALRILKSGTMSIVREIEKGGGKDEKN